MSGPTRRYLALALALVGGCHPQPASPGAPTIANAGNDFATLATAALDRYLEAHPERAVELGLHAYDGRLRDVSAAGLARERDGLARDIAALEAVSPATLEPLQRVEQATLLAALRDELLRLEVVRAPWTNPMSYVGALDLTPYVSRAYAPAPARARAIIALAAAVPGYLQHARANLEPALARTFIDTALLQVRGTASFARKDVPAAMTELSAADREQLVAALETMAKALDGFAEHLEAARARATDDFALGAADFTRMLAQTQGIDTDLATLRRVVEADLERNLAAMRTVAAKIDPEASVAEVVARVAADQPAPGAVLRTATEQSAAMRRFVVEHDIVTIPSDDVAEVVESPPFMRWNAAFLSGAGPFETAPLPSFYYISPPDPRWPPAKQREYVPGTTDLLFITIHEVWPGHFLHGLHVKKNPSRILKSLWNYTSGEGWAHYAEEMMFAAGVGDDPRVHVGQLRHALLRDVRALAAIGLHTQGWSVAQAKKMFVEVAFQDDANAEQQAIRGTFDPMYLAYTVGKLAIMKLRADVEKARAVAHEPFSAREFHDELLSYGAAPLGAVRAAMLGDGAGPPL